MAQKPGGAYIDDLPDDAGGSGYYDLDSTVAEYLAFHYPDGDPLRALLGGAAPGWAERYPAALRGFWRLGAPDGLALDVGAATGRVTFDLARDHRAAFGIDLSRALVRAAARVKETGRARYRTQLEGRLFTDHDVEVADVGSGARFAAADALCLPFADATFATVVAVNLIDRVPDPARALDELARVVAPGGRLVFGSPFTWLETFTPPEKWLGGFARDGQATRGAATVRAVLEAADFVLAEEARLPFYIPHHARSGQLGVSHVQVFDREG